RGNMFLMRRSLLLSGWTRGDPASAPVVANVVHSSIVRHRGVVSVVNIGDVHVIHRTIVFELSVVPTATFITLTAVAEAIIDSAIEAYVLAPVAFIESECPAAPTPIAWGPEETGLRSHHPRTRHKEVTVAVSPVAGCPKITLGGDGRLHIHGQCRGRDCNGYTEL